MNTKKIKSKKLKPKKLKSKKLKSRKIEYMYPFYITGKCFMCDIESTIKKHKGVYLCEKCKKMCIGEFIKKCIKEYTKKCIRDM
jgi:hypothetical protein